MDVVKTEVVGKITIFHTEQGLNSGHNAFASFIDRMLAKNRNELFNLDKLF